MVIIPNSHMIAVVGYLAPVTAFISCYGSQPLTQILCNYSDVAWKYGKREREKERERRK